MKDHVLYDIRDRLSVLPQHLEEFKASAIESLSTLTPQFALTPVRGKIPYLKEWQSIDTSRDDIAKDIASGKADGYGIKLGIPSGGICAIDIDGTAARVKLLDVIGDDDLPITVEFASGKLDRSQYLFSIPPELWDSLKTKTEQIEGEEFGFFWNGRQSVLPPSAHPETGKYFWVHSPDDAPIAPIPDKLLEYWLNSITPPQRTKPQPVQPVTKPQSSLTGDVLTIPIERLLTKEHRAILGGIGQGGRNTTGASLARDLIGVAAMGSIDVDYRGKDYTLQIEGNPEDLFYNYCDGCSPFLSDREGAEIWRKAQNSDHEPCIRDEDILKNCARSYLKDTLPKRGRPKATTPTSDKDYQAIGRKLGIKISDKGIDKDGIPTSKLLKLKLDLFDLLGDRLKFNEMSREIELDKQPIDLNLAKDFVSTALEYDSSTENCLIALNAIATKFKYHPVREYIESLRGKATDLDSITNFPARYFGNSDPLQNRLFFRKLVASVARVKEPGTKDDSLLVLQGRQGAGKSTALKALAGDDWFNDDLRSLDDKDEIAKLSRFWILELAEVDYLFGKKEVELFKRFLSCTEDTFRPPYGRANILVKRTCGLFATTNKSEFLTDPTGDRRYWVVEVKNDIDIEGIRRDRDLIWATALAVYERGEQHYLTEDEKLQHNQANTHWRDDSDPWNDPILEKVGLVAQKQGSIEYVNIQAIMDRILNIPVERQDKRQRNRIGNVLQMAGFERKCLKIDGKNTKVWGREVSSNKLEDSNRYSSNPSTEGWVAAEIPPLCCGYSSYPSNLSLESTEINKNNSDADKASEELINLINTPAKKMGSLGYLGSDHPNPPQGDNSSRYPSSKKMGSGKKMSSGDTSNTVKIGDRVRYVGGILKYKGQSGEVTKVSGANFETTFTTRSHGSIPAAELEVIAA